MTFIPKACKPVFVNLLQNLFVLATSSTMLGWRRRLKLCQKWLHEQPRWPGELTPLNRIDARGLGNSKTSSIAGNRTFVAPKYCFRRHSPGWWMVKKHEKSRRYKVQRQGRTLYIKRGIWANDTTNESWNCQLLNPDTLDPVTPSVTRIEPLPQVVTISYLPRHYATW